MRCFLALELDETARKQLSGIQTQIRQTGVSATYPVPEHLHATLAFFGELTPNEVRKKAESLHAFHHAPLYVELFGLGAFPKPDHIRVVWAGFQKGREKLVKLQQTLADALGHSNDQPFHPHVTLARVKNANNKKRLQSLLAENKDTNFSEFKATTVTLYESRPKNGGPYYAALERVRLQ